VHEQTGCHCFFVAPDDDCSKFSDILCRMTWKQLVALLVALGTFGSAIAFFEYIKRFFSWSWKWLDKPWGSGQPRRKITFTVTPDYSQCHWQEGGRGKVPHMLIICGLHITNAGPAQQGQVIGAYIRRPHTRASNYMNPDVFYPRGFARDVVFNFEIAPPVVNSGEDFVGDVIVVDQFCGKHIAEGVTFRPQAGGAWTRMAQGG